MSPNTSYGPLSDLSLEAFAVVGDDGLTDSERAEAAARVLARRPSRQGLLEYQALRARHGVA